MRTLLVLLTLLAGAPANLPVAPSSVAVPVPGAMTPTAPVLRLVPPAAPLAAIPAVAVEAALGPPPTAGSPAAQADLAIVLWEGRTRTAEEVQRAVFEVELTPDALAETMGAPLELGKRPLTRAVLADAEREARAVYGPVKARMARARPYDADPRVQLAVPREPSFSFPSGHAVRGTLYARLLAELFPPRRDALLERGRQIGFDRVRAGVHYPSDVEAGQRLATALVDAWLADSGFRARVDEARRVEWSGR